MNSKGFHQNSRTLKFFYILVCICISILFEGCQTKKEEVKDTQNKYESLSDEEIEANLWFPEAINEDERVLFFRYNQAFVSYDLKKQNITDMNMFANNFQYEFNTSTRYYTTGNTIYNHYKIVENIGKEIQIVHTMEDSYNQSIFPCAADDSRDLYFFIVYYDREQKDRKIVKLDENNNLIEYENTQGLMMPGVLAGDTLYYNVWSDTSKTYTLYSLDITNVQSMPQEVLTGLVMDNLYYYDSQLFYTNQDKIYSDLREYDRKSVNYFNDEYNVLVQIDIDQDADLSMYVTDLELNKVIATIKSPVDFKIEEGILTVYCIDSIEEIDLKLK